MCSIRTNDYFTKLLDCRNSFIIYLIYGNCVFSWLNTTWHKRRNEFEKQKSGGEPIGYWVTRPRCPFLTHTYKEPHNKPSACRFCRAYIYVCAHSAVILIKCKKRCRKIYCFVEIFEVLNLQCNKFYISAYFVYSHWYFYRWVSLFILLHNNWVSFRFSN